MAQNQNVVTTSFTDYLRRASKLQCPLDCDDEIPSDDNSGQPTLAQDPRPSTGASSQNMGGLEIELGFSSEDRQLYVGDSTVDTELQIAARLSNLRISQTHNQATLAKVQAYQRQQQAVLLQYQKPVQQQSQVQQAEKTRGPIVVEENDSPYKREKSPNSSIGGGPRSTSPPRRSRARPRQVISDDPNFKRSSPPGKLWNPDDVASSPRQPKQSPPKLSMKSPQIKEMDPIDDDVEPERLIKQPETRPISQEQLVAEVKGIYAGLVMVESKCIEVDNAQSAQSENKLNNEQWQALIALHRTLLHEHHDFFLASQHPSASPALRRLASKYAMPARMWRHGIHSFLELLRHRLPGSLEHMLTFIYLAYSMMALLFETVPAFEDTWIECLGDLGRYRMAIEDDDVRDREIWTSVSRHWYSKASDEAPTTGRLYHHLAILAKPDPLQQLYHYTKSLCVPIPFNSARESIMALFDPILGQDKKRFSMDAPFIKFIKAHFNNKSHADIVAALTAVDSFIGYNKKGFPVDASFIKAHSILFNDKSHADIAAAHTAVDSLTSQHKARRGRGARRNAAYWKERNNEPDASLFDERELLFGNKHGGLKVSCLANLDSQLKVNNGNGDDLIMSSHCAKELGILEQISTDFEDPCLQSISGHATAVRGILRNVQFRLKGSSVTFRRNFWVCDAINEVVDVMIGANFIKDNFKMLFEKVKGCVSTFATWFSKTKKETPEQKREREEAERQQKIKVNEQEIKRLQRENEMHQRASQANSGGGGSAQSGAQGSRQ